MDTTILTDEQRQATKRYETIAGMREMLDFLEENPIIPLPAFRHQNAFEWNTDDIKEQTRAMSPCDKEVAERFYSLSRMFGVVAFDLNYQRDDVCTKTVVGQETIPERTTAAYTRDIVEWECPPSLLGGE